MIHLEDVRFSYHITLRFHCSTNDFYEILFKNMGLLLDFFCYF